MFELFKHSILLCIILLHFVFGALGQEYHQFLGTENGNYVKITINDPILDENKIIVPIRAVWVDKDLRKIDNLQSRIVLKKSNLIIKPGDMLRCTSFENHQQISFNNATELHFTINPDYGEGEAIISFKFGYAESETQAEDLGIITDFMLKLPNELYMKYNIKLKPITVKRIYTNKAQEEKRIALVIGNSEYSYVPELVNPGNDARAISEVLKQLNFTVKTYQNLNLDQMKQVIEDFGRELDKFNIALIYYAGHGIQVNGLNYLVPVDAQVYNENDADRNCLQVNKLLVKLQSARIKTSLLILDACRDNPFTGSWQGNPLSEGLALMDAISGTLIAYATAPGKTASDGKNTKNGMYTAALLQHIKTPGITVLEIMQRVRTQVREDSNGRQVPWESTSLEGNFYFNK